MNAKIDCRLLGCLAVGWLALPTAMAGEFERNTVAGLWQMDETLNSRWLCQPPLETLGFSITGAPGPHYLPESPPQTWLNLGSATSPFAGLKPAERMVMPNPAGANGPPGATGTHDWTVVMDVRFLSLPPWTAILQSTPDNSNDAEIFLNSAGALYFIGSTTPPLASDPLALNTWHRLAFRAHYDSGAGNQVLRAYLNGLPTTQTAGNAVRAALNGRYSLPPQGLLFSDEDNETARVDLGGVAFWGRALDDADIAAIGGYQAAGITWPGITPSTGCPPVPALTGNLWFGGVNAQFTPNTVALAATATAPTYPGAVATVQINLGVNGGSLPGLPQHRFGGTITGHVMPNGDIIVPDTVAVNFTGGGLDLGTFDGVSFVRSGITLGPAGASAGSLKVFLPAGFGVALEPLGKNVLVRATKTAVALDATLNPAADLALVRADFTTDLSSSTLYPICDRVPVRFAANSLTYSPTVGRFTFTPTEVLVYHRQVQLGILFNQILSGQPSAVVPASNDFYFLAATDALGPVRIDARPDGAAAISSMTFVLDPLKFGTAETSLMMHFPRMRVTWNQTSGSQFSIIGDQLDTANSKLAGALLSEGAYAQGVPSADCEGAPGTTPPPVEEIHFQPSAAEWRFTPDGGLRATGTVQAGATNTSPLTVEWAAYTENSTPYHAHRISTGFSTCRVACAGVFARADQLAGLAEHELPFALLFSGHGAPGNESLSERPGTSAYLDGLADYPGFNLRTTAAGSHMAVSRLAGVEVPPYPLAGEAKYHLRDGGVSGRHLSDASAPPIQFSAFGAAFEVTALNLAFLDGVNTASGVNGSLDVPPPADFDLTFKSLMFGGQGQLKEAAVFTPQADKILGPAYWGLEFTPLALEFPQPKVCPAPGPGTGFIKVAALATLTGLGPDPMAGNLSVLNGNLVVESDPEAKGNGPVSRFAPGADLTVNGPAGGGGWIVHPATQVAVNKHPSVSNGVLTLGGLMNLPFFTDMPVILSTNSNNQTPTPPEIYVRKPWSALDATPHDPEHVGVPAGVTLATYRSTAAWDPRATRKWQGILDFDLPLQLGADRVFRSRVPVSGDVILFHLTQAVASMTPASAEITLDGSASLNMASLIPQINVAKLLQNNGILSLSPALGNALNGALDGVAGLDALLADHLQDLLEPGLALAAANRADAAFLSALATASNRSGKLDELTAGLAADVTTLLYGGASGMNGKWRRDFLAEITAARQGVQSAQTLVANAANLQQLGSAIGTAISVGGIPASPSEQQLAALQSAFAQAIVRLQAIEAALATSGDLTTALSSALGGTPAITAVVQKAVNDLKAKWAPASAATAAALYAASNASHLATDLAAALTERYAGSDFAGNATMLLRQHAGDPQTLARQALDDTLRAAEQLVAASLNNAVNAPVLQALGLPGLGDYLAAARLRGYARINGDALHELRLDGQVRLQVPDQMKFDGWFLLRDLDSTTPGGACLAAGGAATEIGMGAAADLDWAGQSIAVKAGGKVAVSATGNPVALAGDLALLGAFGFSEFTLNDIKLGFGFGANNGYLYGRGAGKLSAMSVEAGVFVGQTCDIAVIANADEDIGDLLGKVLPGFTLPVRGAMVYGEGGMSLMPLIGIPPSCVLDLRVHGGQGVFGFFNSGGQVVAGVKNLQGVSGELLCLANASGKFSTVLAGVGTVAGGSPHVDSLNGSTTAKLKGKVGSGWFSYTFTKKIRLNVTAAPLDYDLDY